MNYFPERKERVGIDGAMSDFHQDLQFSLDSDIDSELNKFYHEQFPELEKIEIVTKLSWQKRGVDKVLILASGKRILIDEKIRREDYGDILLEEYSNWERKIVGWLGNDKFTDYIVYMIEPTKTVYFLPFLLLQRAWQSNHDYWLATFGRREAQNKGYITTFIAVPTDVLLEAIKKEM